MIDAERHTIVPDDFLTHVPVEIGSFCSIASGCRVASGQHPGVTEPAAVSDFPFAEHGWGEYPPSDMGEGVIIGSDVWIGQDVLLLDRVRIGHGARIGAGAVVTRDVDPYTVVGGNPIQLINRRFDPIQRRALELIAWWDWDDQAIREALPKMANIDLFIDTYGGNDAA